MDTPAQDQDIQTVEAAPTPALLLRLQMYAAESGLNIFSTVSASPSFKDIAGILVEIPTNGATERQFDLLVRASQEPGFSFLRKKVDAAMTGPNSPAYRSLCKYDPTFLASQRVDVVTDQIHDQVQRGDWSKVID